MTDSRSLFILGAGGHGRETAELVSAINASDAYWHLEGFLSDDRSVWGRSFDGIPVIGALDDLWSAVANASVVIAIGRGITRQALARTLQERGIPSPVLIHPSAQVSKHASLGSGTTVCAGSIITTNCRLGAHVIVNRSVNLSHDCVIGDYCTIAPGSVISGNVTVCDGADLGANCTLLPGVRVGAWSRVGAGAVVTRDVQPDSTVMGVPARAMTDQ